MLYYALKIAISAAVIVAVSEIAKRNSGMAALVAALPLTSLLAFIWLHLEGSPSSAIGELSTQVFWLVLPSLVLFLAVPRCFLPGHHRLLSGDAAVVAQSGHPDLKHGLMHQRARLTATLIEYDSTEL